MPTNQCHTRRMLPDEFKLCGTLHIFVAFDWGDEIDLDRARRLFPAESQDLARRRRTPSSIAYRPAPLRYPLKMPPIELPEIGQVRSFTGADQSPAALAAIAEVIVFDFGGVSVSLQIPFELTPAALSRLAGALADPSALVEAARTASTNLYQQLQPAIEKCGWSPLGEEYFVFEIPPNDRLPAPPELIAKHAGWLAGLVSLEADPLSPSEVESAIQSRISYSPGDMLVAAWSSAVLFDRQCEETLQAIEFANLQLLEYRFIDDLLDQRMAAAYSTIHRTLRGRLPFWRTQARPLRRLGELRIEVNSLFERTGNALKIVGDQYLARVYHMIAQRLHLSDWEQSIRRSLDVVEGAYQVVSDQSGAFRIELLEIVVIVLIAIEILMAIFRH
ncbi:MAG TPA: hypothetical protein VGI75_04910 [Pirellulales bacterium]